MPKTIDNDLSATEVTFGFHTAVQIATEAIDRLHTTAESHDRVIVCEVMGRHAGWIATYAGIAGGAAEVLVPEEPFDIDVICRNLQARHAKGRFASIVVVAEGAVPMEGTMALASREVDQFGHVRLGGIANTLAEEIEKRTGFETRVTILGHIQRGGTPTAFDRVLATRFGIAAIDAVHDGAFGQMVALRVRPDRPGAARRSGQRAEDGGSRAPPPRGRGLLRLISRGDGLGQVVGAGCIQEIPQRTDQAGGGADHRVVVEGADLGPRLGGDDGAGGQIPRLQTPFVVPVDPAGRHPAQVEGGRPEPADVAHHGHHAHQAPSLPGPPLREV